MCKIKEICVTVSCITYNHEKYIADALESFLMQKTTFAYEIIVHEDASTDRTADILREYERRYPDLIKPIYQTENQYSKYKNVGTLIREKAKGKYMAPCEGDDYWTDPYKLQKQVDYMEKHPECSLCVHATYRVSANKKMLKEHIRPSVGSRVLSTEEVIMWPDGRHIHTSSFLYPRALSINMPAFYKNAPVGDYPSAIFLALKGTVYYIDEFMSAYRCKTPGSWTNRISKDKEMAGEVTNKLLTMLDEVNEYSEYKYADVINERKKIYNFKQLIDHGMYEEARGEEYKKLYLELPLMKKIKITLKEHFPGITKMIVWFKSKLI